MSSPQASPPTATSLVTVVIPAFDAAQTIRASVQSALRQDPAPTVIVVDDGSRDDTGIIAGSAGALVLQHRNAGPAAARNRGAAATRSEFLVFLDADDQLREGFSSASLAALENDPSAAAVIPNKLMWSHRGDHPLWRLDGTHLRLGRHDLNDLLDRHWLHPTALVRRRFWEQYRFEEAPGLVGVEDTLFWIELLLAGHALVVLDEPHVQEQKARSSPLTANVARMRRARLTLYLRLIRDQRLTSRERFTTALKVARLSIWRLFASLVT